MSYEYDIFISYKWHQETIKWVGEHFLPLLDHWVGLELAWTPSVCVHGINRRITPGSHWPEELKQSLAKSRVLIALWTKNYFTSRWCANEFAHMLAREHSRERGRGEPSYGLVIPVVIHDGNDFPESLSHVQRLDIQPFYNTRMRSDSEMAAALGRELSLHAPGLAAAISGAPEWQPRWPDEHVQSYFEAFYRPGDDPGSGRVPGFGA